MSRPQPILDMQDDEIRLVCVTCGGLTRMRTVTFEGAGWVVTIEGDLAEDATLNCHRSERVVKFAEVAVSGHCDVCDVQMAVHVADNGNGMSGWIFTHGGKGDRGRPSKP
jgi:hypothetical protein